MENNNETTIDYKAEYKRLKLKCVELEKMREEQKAHLNFVKQRYAKLEGMVEALEFAVRCNSVSGADVEGALAR